MATYSASDPGGGDIFWSISGTDQLDFTITEGELNFADTPDFENPTDDDPDNDYEITVMASDGDLAASLSDSINVTVTVTDVNEAPDIDLPDLPGYDENGTDPVATYMAVDPEGDAIAWTLPDTNHATDRRAFTITGGVLKFEDAPDFESPQDSRPYNSYKVTIRASDGRLATSVNVTINVTDVNEKPAVAPPPIADQTITASVFREISLQGRFTDPDGDTLTYTAETSRPRIATASVNASDNTLTLAALSAGSARITVTAADRSSGHADRLTVAQVFTVTVEPHAPAKVTGLMGMSGSIRGTIDLDWNPADRADDYEVEQWRRRLLRPDDWVLLTASEVTIDTANSSAVVRGLEGGETYRHRVRGTRGTGANKVEGAWSDELETTLTLPDKVTGLNGAPGTNHGEIDLVWNDAVGANGYQVQQRTPGNDWVVLSPLSSGFNINDTTAVVSDLDPDETYRYQVRGTNVHGEGDWSDATEMIAAHDERPDKPAGLDASYMIGLRGVALDWQAAGGAAAYEVRITPTPSTQQTVFSGESAEITGLVPETQYRFIVRARKTYRGTPLYSLWSDPVRRDGPRPTSIGHQEDHAVGYKVRPLTAAPGLPAGFPDPAAAIRAALQPAADAWNNAAAQLNKGMKICAFRSCAGSNHDGWAVTVKTVSMNTKDAGETDGGDHESGCGRSVACVKAEVTADDHLRNMSLIIEEPAWECRGSKKSTCAQHLRIYWTNVQGDDMTRAVDMTTGSTVGLYYYIVPTMTHEFGHTLGLHDFYLDETTGLNGILNGVMLPNAVTLQGAVMHTGDVINDEDKKQLEAIYAYHDSASH